MKKLIWLFVFAFVFSGLALAHEELTVDKIYHPGKRLAFSGSPTFVRWSDDGTSFVQPRVEEGTLKLINVNALNGTETVFYDSAEVAAALVKAGLDAKLAQDASRVTIGQNDRTSSYLLSADGDLFVYHVSSKTAKRLTNGNGEELEADFSPDGSMVSFIRGNDIYVVEVATGKETRYTNDGAKNTLNGYLAWVYEEELYGRGQNRGYWWSPDSKSMVFLKTDDSMIPNFILADDTEIDQRIEDTNYPQAGDPNPIVKLGVIQIGSKSIRFVDTSKYPPKDFLVSRVDWSPDSKWIIYQGQNREQTFLDMNAVSRDGKSTKTLFQDRTPAWIDSPGNPYWLKDGSFVWTSPRDGWKHLYHYDANGKLIRQITKGNWEVQSFYGVDQENGWVYFSATKDQPNGGDAYRIKTDGSGIERLTKTAGAHRPSFNSTFTHFVDFWSDINTPLQTRLHRADGSVEKVINENKVELLDKYELSTPEFMSVKNRDGFEMDAYMIKPPNFDSEKKYPVITFVYGGPHAPQVRNSWGGSRYIFHQMLAQKGYIIFVCDPRAASGGKGEKETWTAYKKLGVTEQLDMADSVKWLHTMPFVDKDRIGVWGWSYGGYMTLFAMTHSKFYKAGISVAPVSDYRLYDSIYTERYMLTPQNNPEGYAMTDLNSKAKDLHGELLLVHGAMDNNVHMQNATMFAFAAQRAGVQLDFEVYPTQRHGISNPWQTYHLYTKMAEFWMENL
ncbi:MAG: S9 family peptidase [Acidobacteriota bacterium]|nr:S9 family peptidase [Acidobacteriota bacterium]MDH3528039.1 S9 family peptidase [Acidobacteriota bacterium]